MTIETFNTAKRLYEKLNIIKGQLKEIDKLIENARNLNKVKTRVHGFEIELPRSAFQSEVMQRKKDLESQLTDLENELSAL